MHKFSEPGFSLELTNSTPLSKQVVEQTISGSGAQRVAAVRELPEQFDAWPRSADLRLVSNGRPGRV